MHNTLRSTMAVVKCAAHILQLAAYDVIKTMQSDIESCRKAVESLRCILSGTHKVPILDNATCWNSTYMMMTSLLNIKGYIKENDTNMPKVDWNFVNIFIQTFKPLVECTHKLQGEQYVIGDFYRDWLSCELELLELVEANNDYALTLVNSVKYRKDMFLQNEAFLAAIYVDPRFNFLHSPYFNKTQKYKAVVSTLKTHMYICVRFVPI